MDAVDRSLAPAVAEALAARHRRFLDFLEPRLGSRAAAEDLLQAAFVKGLERGGRLRDAESAVAWFYRLLRRALVDGYRHRAAERRALAGHAAERRLHAPDEAELHAVACQCVGALLPTLTGDQAGILRLVDLDGVPVGEAAARLGIRAGTAAVRLHRARRALRARVEQTCRTCAEHACLDCSCPEAARPA
jgi:RNA polymerase sigma-70 factor (ECF subfamily)